MPEGQYGQSASLSFFPNHSMIICFYAKKFLEEVPPKPREEKTGGDVICVGLYAVELVFLVNCLYATIVHARRQWW